MKRGLTTTGWIIISVFAVFFIFTVVFRKDMQIFLNAGFRNYGLLGLAAISFVLEFVPQYIAPQLFSLNAFLFGYSFWETVIALYIGGTLGAIVGFEVGHHFKNDISKHLFAEKTRKKVKAKINKLGRWGVLISAITPIPYIPMLFGAMHIRRRDFALFGIIPRFLFVLYICAIAFAIF